MMVLVKRDVLACRASSAHLNIPEAGVSLIVEREQE